MLRVALFRLFVRRSFAVWFAVSTTDGGSTFRAVAVDRPRLLARHSEIGYVGHPAMAMDREPEAVSEAEQRQISTEARLRFAEARADENARADSKAWADRLRRAEQSARDRHVDVHRWQIEIRRAVVAMEEAIASTNQATSRSPSL
jgi:hypothetical protein